ncbi:MAG: hypothetical protein KUL86_10840 [Castellaniella sp.]|nr:hypothetical protein [Castellaniella sp.]
MSKKIAPTRGEGISTPQIIAANPKLGNTQAFSVAAFAETLDATIQDRAIEPMQTAAEVFGWIETLASLAKEKNTSRTKIDDLVKIIHHLAGDFCNHIDCEREMLRDEHLPRLLAALPNGGEA